MPSQLAKTRRIRDQKCYRPNADACRIIVHTFHMQVSLSSNGHGKLKERVNLKEIVNFKKVNRDPETAT